MDMYNPNPSDREIIERVLAFETGIVDHLQVREAMKAISAIRLRSTVRDNPDAKARALLVVGESGSGKSTVLERYLTEAAKAGGSGASEDGDTMPILHIEMPSKPSRRQAVAAIINELGYPVREEWNTNQILDRIAYLFQEMKVEIVLIDEAHHIIEAKGEGEEEISEFLKSLLNRSRAQFVLFGLPTLLRLKGYAQLKRRLEPGVVLSPYHWDTFEGRVEFMAVLDSLEESMGLPEPSNLKDTWHALRLYCATGGYVGLVSKYLSEAYRRALTNGYDHIGMELLADVHADFEKGNEQAPVSDAYLAMPKKMAHVLDADENPFLADEESFGRLWRIMASKRATMARMAKPRKVRRTRFKGTGETPKAFK